MVSDNNEKQIVQRWNVSGILGSKKEKVGYAAIMLNSPILQPNRSLIEKVWKEGEKDFLRSYQIPLIAHR